MTELKSSDTWRDGVLTDLAEMNPDRGSATASIPGFRYVDISYLSVDGLTTPESIKWISRQDAPSRAQRLIRSGDSLVSTVRPERGARGLVPDILDRQVASTGICVLRPRIPTDAEFVYATIRDPAFTAWCVSHETGTSYPAVSPQDIARFPILLPPLNARKRIAEMLTALDEHLEVKTRLLRLIDESIQAAGAVAIATSVTTTEVGLSKIATFTNGYSYKSSELVQESEAALVNLKNFGRNGGFRLDGLKPFEGTPKPTQILSAGEIMVAKTDLTQDAEVVGRCVRMPAIPAYKTYVASLDVAIVRPKGMVSQEALLSLLSQPEFREHCIGYTNGTTVLHMSKDALPAYTLTLPDDDRMTEMVERVSVLGATNDRLLAELHSLSQLRDFLLPRLLSGELRIEAAEEMAEMV